MANFGQLTAEIGSGVWDTQQISTGLASCLCYCSYVVHHRPTKLCMMFDRLLGLYIIYIYIYIYIFWGSCPLTEFCPVQNSLYVQVLHSPILAALRHSSSGRQPNFGVVQGMELRNFHRSHHLYSHGRPSRWALAHILVMVTLCNRVDHYIFALWCLSSFFSLA